MIPVSARLAARSKRAAPTDKVLSANLWSESGVGQLQAWVTTKIRPAAGALTLTNSAALARAALDGIEARAELRMSARTDDPAVTAAIEAEQVRIEELRADQLSWGNELERVLFNARNDLKDKVKLDAEQLQTSTADLISAAGRRDEDMIVARVDADLDAQAAELSDHVNAAIASICAQVLEDLAIDRMMELSSTGTGSWHVKAYTPGGTTATNALAAGMTGVTGYGLVMRLGLFGGGAAGAGGAAGTAAGAATTGFTIAAMAPYVLPIAAGLGVAYAIHRVRSGVQHKQELTVWARNEIARAAGERQLEIDRALTGAKLDIVDVVRAGLNERTKEVTSALDAAKAAKAQSDKERAAARTHDQKILNTVKVLRDEADGLIAKALRAVKLTAPNTEAFARPPR
jgi:hypothetical protein